ncbi:hypothetical protein A4A49_28589 [Nicotiana attenuata]|uniref:Uncharacterized protein n=1 Tax=Nicotiana attenuata TaxID=49451 RepID=A0A1J6K5Y9_NICAT|nr:hypothetical protein A4A49_28589 [Nicotiana attenuata]
MDIIGNGEELDPTTHRPTLVRSFHKLPAQPINNQCHTLFLTHAIFTSKGATKLEKTLFHTRHFQSKATTKITPEDEIIEAIGIHVQ